MAWEGVARVGNCADRENVDRCRGHPAGTAHPSAREGPVNAPTTAGGVTTNGGRARGAGPDESEAATGQPDVRSGTQAEMVVVANRLPFDIEKLPDGSTRARQAPGGLVTALAPILSRRQGAWIGWPGSPDVTLEPTTTDGLSLHPITLTSDEVDKYYEGFSNETLWPLYHDAVVESHFHREWWEAYQKVNERFAQAAADLAAPGATVWVHDYQLQLVPQFLRRLRPDVRIGFFL